MRGGGGEGEREGEKGRGREGEGGGRVRGRVRGVWRGQHARTISFCVRVPVLSVRRYSTRPSSSGMVLVRTTVPGMAASLWIIHEYTIFPISRFTRRLRVGGELSSV